jgi:hypothetical protein
MIIKIKTFITSTYGEFLKEGTKKVIGDLLLLAAAIFLMFWVEGQTKYKSITLFEVTYRLDILLFYIMAFIFILTTSVLFMEIRNLLKIISRFVITRFPRMNGDFGPGKMIMRDLVQIVIMILVFYPVSTYIKDYSFRGFQPVYVLSMIFLILALLFIFDILLNALRLFSSHFAKLGKLFKFPKKESL